LTEKARYALEDSSLKYAHTDSVWRGIRRPKNEIKELIGQLKDLKSSGKEFRWNMITPTIAKKDIAEWYLSFERGDDEDLILFEVLIGEGVAAVNVSEQSFADEETEVLIPAGAKLYVEGARKAKKKPYSLVQLKYVKE